MRSTRVVAIVALLAGCSSGSGNNDASGAAGAGGGATGGTGGATGSAGTTGSGGRGGASGATGGGGTGGGAVSCPFVAPPSCSFTACGGDLVGTWTLDYGCYAPGGTATGILLGCDSGQFTKLTVTMSGSWTFGADLTYTRTISEQDTYEFTEPLACDSAATDCSNLDVPDYRATCTGTGCCSCTQVRPPSTRTDSGTYAVSGSTVTLTTGANHFTYQYCVSGNMATFSVQAGSVFGGHR